ncbi:MAG TPA: hypothetical protein VGF58_07715 [Burkholderiales bacterium]|jgi:hypothetical protein
MSIELASAFAPTYKLTKPVESADNVTLNCAKWDTSASVLIRNEPNRRFKVGFIQVCFEVEDMVTYELPSHLRRAGLSVIGHDVFQKLSKSPVNDSDPNMLPWYEDSTPYSPEVNGTAGDVLAQAKMDDHPTWQIPWILKSPAAEHMLEISHRRKFKNWLAVQDLAAPQGANSIVKVLSQFNYTFEIKCKVDTSKPLGQRCIFATGADKPNKPEMVWPPTPIHSSVWVNECANDMLEISIKDRQIVKSTNAPVGPVHTGVNVKNLASKFK